MEGSSATAPPGLTNFVTQRTVPPTPLTTEHSSALNLTANSSEDGTTPGDRTPEWTVRQFPLSFVKLTKRIRMIFTLVAPDL